MKTLGKSKSINKSLRILFIFNGIFVFASNLLGPLFAVFVSGIDSDILSISISWSVFLFSTVLFTFLVYEMGDKVKEKEYLLIAGLLIRGLVWFSYIFVGNIYFLIFLQMILGIGEALGTPAFDVIFAEHLDSNKHMADYANWKVISNLAGAAAVFIGGVIVENFGFAHLFGIMSMLAFASAFGLYVKRKFLK